MIINVKGKEVTLKYSFRAMLMYENITNKTFSPSTITDIIIYMLCVIMSSGKNINLTLDELLDMIDEKPELMQEFSEWLTKEIMKQNMLSQDTEVTVDEEKKTK